jgi:hypothetical protein
MIFKSMYLVSIHLLVVGVWFMPGSSQPSLHVLESTGTIADVAIEKP